MSSFNWFRRGYDESSETEDAKTDETTNDSTSAEAAADDSDAPASAEDYLAWAKAAYQNIQQQQATVEEPEAEPEPEPEPVEPEPESEPEPAVEAPVGSKAAAPAAETCPQRFLRRKKLLQSLSKRKQRKH